MCVDFPGRDDNIDLIETACERGKSTDTRAKNEKSRPKSPGPINPYMV